MIDATAASVIVPAWDSGERIVPPSTRCAARTCRALRDRGQGVGRTAAAPPCARTSRRAVRALARAAGSGQARNRGVAARRGRWIAFCSDDCVPGRDWLRLRVAKHREGFDVVGGSVTNGRPRIRSERRLLHRAHRSAALGRVLTARRCRTGAPTTASCSGGVGPCREDTPTGEDSVSRKRRVNGARWASSRERRSRLPRHGLALMRGHQRAPGRGTPAAWSSRARAAARDGGHRVPSSAGRAGCGESPSARPQVPVYWRTPLTACGHVGTRDRRLAGARRAARRSGRRSRSGSMPQRAPTRGQLGRERPAVRALVALVVGHAALERHPAGVVADRADLGDLLARTAATSARRGRQLGALLLDRPRPAPASWISVGAQQATAGWARFHWQASCSGVSPWRSAIGRMRSIRSRPALDPARRGGSRGGRPRRTRGRPPGRPRTARRSPPRG